MDYGGGDATVEISKLRDYHLDAHQRRGRYQARVFYQLRASAAGVPDEYGDRYSIDFEVSREDRDAWVLKAWIVLRGETAPRHRRWVGSAWPGRHYRRTACTRCAWSQVMPFEVWVCLTHSGQDWLLACPQQGFFVPVDSESTDTL